jgi:hypothetical protein
MFSVGNSSLRESWKDDGKEYAVTPKDLKVDNEMSACVACCALGCLGCVTCCGW